MVRTEERLRSRLLMLLDKVYFTELAVMLMAVPFFNQVTVWVGSDVAVQFNVASFPCRMSESSGGVVISGAAKKRI